MHHSEMRKFLYSLFLQKVQIWGLGVKKVFFLQFLLIFYPLDPDPGSQNLRDPEPKHCCEPWLNFPMRLSK